MLNLANLESLHYMIESNIRTLYTTEESDSKHRESRLRELYTLQGAVLNEIGILIQK